MTTVQQKQRGISAILGAVYKKLSYDWPVAVCKQLVFQFLKSAVQHGSFRLRLSDGTVKSFGDGTPCGCDDQPVTLRVFVSIASSCEGRET
jgi:hypothetical protein